MRKVIFLGIFLFCKYLPISAFSINLVIIFQINEGILISTVLQVVSGKLIPEDAWGELKNVTYELLGIVEPTNN